MKITPKNSVKRFQMGGQMTAEPPVEEPVDNAGEAAASEQVPEEGGEQDPMMMLALMSAQALQSQDCQMAMQVCQAFLQIVQQMQGGGAPEEQGEPVFAKKGCKMVRRIKKDACGAKMKKKKC